MDYKKEEKVLQKKLQGLEKLYGSGFLKEKIKEKTEFRDNIESFEKPEKSKFSKKDSENKFSDAFKIRDFEDFDEFSSGKQSYSKSSINKKSEDSNKKFYAGISSSNNKEIHVTKISDKTNEIFDKEISYKDFINLSDKGPNKATVEKASRLIKSLKNEISKIIIGQEKVVDSLIRGILCDGHVLLEGIPGIAKTLTIRAIGKASGCQVNRIQFTVDLLPSDILGINAYTPGKGLETIKGPIFANYLIADEINRSPPKTQSALIEAMQEKQVTIGKKAYPLPSPFFVMATRNPIENLGVYPLPEAQMDRFLFNVTMDYPKEEDEIKILDNNITLKNFDDFKLRSVITPKNILELQKIVKEIYVSDRVKKYIMDIVNKTRDKNSDYAENISYGVSPRGGIGLFIASRAHTLIQGRNYVLPEDVREIAYDVLRHRIILSYKATINKVNADNIIKKILDEVNIV